MTKKHFLCYRPFVGWIHWWLVASPHKGPVMPVFDAFLLLLIPAGWRGIVVLVRVSGRLPGFAECISLKLLDRFTPSKVVWNCLDGSVFCVLLRVSSDYAQPITGQVTEVTYPVIGWAQPELTPSKRQKTDPVVVHRHSNLPICTIWASPWARNIQIKYHWGPDFAWCLSLKTAGWIYTFQSSMELCKPIVVQHHGLRLAIWACPWATGHTKCICQVMGWCKTFTVFNMWAH